MGNFRFGYGLLLVYWRYVNSEYKNGQSICKRITKIVVVDSENGYLPIRKSVLRTSVVVLVFLLNGWALPIFQNQFVGIIASTIIFGGGVALFYSLVFNRKTRQGLHDMLVKSYVIKRPPQIGATSPKTPLLHKRVTFGLVTFGLILGIVGFSLRGKITPTFGLIETTEWNELQELQNQIFDTNNFFSVGVQLHNSYQSGSTESRKR